MLECQSRLLAERPTAGRMAQCLARLACLACVQLSLGCSSSEGTGAPHTQPVSGGAGGTSPMAGSGGAIAGTGANPGTGGSTGGASGATGGVGGAAGGAAGTTGGSSTDMPVITNKAVHRLSNVEYDNTLRDLTGTALRFGDGFVREEAEGFDNIATALSMSPRQVEDYFVAAREVSADVFAQPALRDRVVTCTPDAGTACAETVIRDFGLRAFRRPVTAVESTRLLESYQEALALGVDALGALQHVVHILLSSPQFLYRVEFDPNLADPTPHPLDGYELASRMSYALWSSMPDDALFAAAAGSMLAAPEQLSAEVDRLLGHERSEMLVKNFAAQWFGSARLSDHVASPTAFAAYTPELGASMQREMELYFSEFLYGEAPYSAFLTTDVNFVDAGLAAHYGMSPPSEPGFQRVVNTTDERMGVLGLAGFLTHTSRETRTSPIIRGKWILDAVWCTELTLPTDIVVEPLDEPAEGEPPTTVREQMMAHRTSPACSGCHNMIDPIGLALEHFDGIGRYRAAYENGLTIDATGVMPEGQMVDGLESLAAALAGDPQFMACAATKFGTYALGEHFAEANRNLVVSSWTAGAPTLRSLIKQVVSHDAFRFRKAESL
jgi:hypothetical protein